MSRTNPSETKYELPVSLRRGEGIISVEKYGVLIYGFCQLPKGWSSGPAFPLLFSMSGCAQP